MTLRFYLAPQVEYVADGLPTRSPMHYQSFGRSWSAIDYGAYGERGGFLVMANVTDNQHRMLQSKPEITTLVEYGRWKINLEPETPTPTLVTLIARKDL